MFLVDHRNDQWISENRLSGITANEQTEMSNEQLNDSTNSLTGRKRARLKRRLNDMDSTDFPHDSSVETTDQTTRKDYKPIVSLIISIVREISFVLFVEKVKHIEKIWIGQCEIDCWYHSPFPEEYGKQRLLYICESCMKYMRLKSTYLRHLVCIDSF